MEIYAVKINPSLDFNLFSKLVPFASREKQAQLKSIKNYPTAAATLVANLLILHLIAVKLKIPRTEIEFGYNEFGKPFLINNQNFQFNLSHSGDWVVCAIDSLPIGIDIEKYQEENLPLEIFSPDELQQYQKLSSSQQSKFFFKVWTRKESFLKARGVGLNCELQKLEIINNTSKTMRFEQKCFIKDYNFVPNYSLSVCAQHNKFPAKIIPIKQNTLINFFLTPSK